MKKLLLFLFLSFSFFSKAQTSVYHPLPDSNAMWSEACSCWSQGCNNGCGWEQIYQLTIAGDTVIGSYSYHKLLEGGVIVQNFYCPPPDTSPYSSGYACAFRQDIPNKKVFFVPYGDSTETLLYDFNLSLGDTIRNTYNSQSCPDNWVSEIDSVIVGGNYHTRYWISEDSSFGMFNYAALIEGVGSTLGLFNQLCYPFESGCDLGCLNVENINVYPGGNPCNPMLSADEKTKNNTLVIFPNPAHDNFTIAFNQPLKTEAQLNIYDMTGRDVMEQKIHSPLSTVHYQLSSGVYFVRVRDGERTAMQKLVIE